MKKNYFSIGRNAFVAFAMLAAGMSSFTSCNNEDPILNDRPAVEQTVNEKMKYDGQVFTDYLQQKADATQGTAVVLHGTRAAVGQYQIGQDPRALQDNADVVYDADNADKGVLKMDDGTELHFTLIGSLFSINDMPGAEDVLTVLGLDNGMQSTRIDDDAIMQDAGKLGLKVAAKAAENIPGIGGMVLGPLCDMFADKIGAEDSPYKLLSDQINSLQADVKEVKAEIQKKFDELNYGEYLTKIEDLESINSIFSNKAISYANAIANAKDSKTKEEAKEKLVHLFDSNTSNLKDGHADILYIMDGVHFSTYGTPYKLTDAYAFYCTNFESDAVNYRLKIRLREVKAVSQMLAVLAIYQECLASDPLFANAKEGDGIKDDYAQLSADYAAYYNSNAAVNIHEDKVFCTVDGSWFLADKDPVKVDWKDFPSKKIAGVSWHYGQMEDTFCENLASRTNDWILENYTKDGFRFLNTKECETVVDITNAGSMREGLSNVFNLPSTDGFRDSWMMFDGGFHIKVYGSDKVFMINKCVDLKDSKTEFRDKWLGTIKVDDDLVYAKMTDHWLYQGACNKEDATYIIPAKHFKDQFEAMTEYLNTEHVVDKNYNNK